MCIFFCWLFVIFVLVFVFIVFVVLVVLLWVMIFNVCMFLFDGVNVWENCCELFVCIVCDVDLDVFGIQELYKEQGDYVVVKLLYYVWFGEGCCGGDGDEYMGVFYCSDWLKVIMLGDFWLFDMFDVFGSISWGYLFLWMVIWVLFECKVDGWCFYFFNIYLFYCDQDEDVCSKGVKEILDWLEVLLKNVLIVFIGDFNILLVSYVYVLFIGLFMDVCISVLEYVGLDKIFYNFIGMLDQCIDWIFICGFIVMCVDMIIVYEGVVYLLDYFLVLVVLCWNDLKGSWL